MAKTLMVRPYVVAASSHALSCNLVIRLAQRPKSFVSTVILGRTRTRYAKLESHRSNDSIEEGYVYGRSSGFGFTQLGGRRFSSRATNVNDAGSIDSPLMESMQKKIKEHLNAESVAVKDAYGDGRHVSIDVVSSSFEGQSAVNRQRMVYKAIWEELQSTVHAVDQMTTRTPSEAASGK